VFLCDFIALFKVAFLDFCLEYRHNDGITFPPDLELKNSFCLALICSGNARIPRNKVLINTLFTFNTSFKNTTAEGHHTAQ
jgi:hypothetical protein